MNLNVTPKIAKTKLDLKNIRFTQLLFPTNSQKLFVEFPSKELRDVLLKQGEDFRLSGVEAHNEGRGNRFNFILSNGRRSEMKAHSAYLMKDYMFPKTFCQIYKVEIHSNGSQYLRGFRFLDSIGNPILEIGNIRQEDNSKTFVEIHPDESIIGFKAKEFDDF